MDAPHWSPAAIQDFARGHQITYAGSDMVDLPFPAWLDEVVDGRSRYGPTEAMAVAHPDDHELMIGTFMQVLEGAGLVVKTSFRCNIDGIWRRMTLRSLNLLGQADIAGVIATCVIDDLDDAEVPESTTGRV